MQPGMHVGELHSWAYIIEESYNMNSAKAYWRANIRLVTVLLVIWFIASYLFGIILVEPLNQIRIGGYQLGFWFAQQGSIYTFLILIFVYAFWMNGLDKKYNVREE